MAYVPAALTPKRRSTLPAWNLFGIGLLLGLLVSVFELECGPTSPSITVEERLSRLEGQIDSLKADQGMVMRGDSRDSMHVFTWDKEGKGWVRMKLVFK